jgi:hypothetical protein
VLSNGGLSSPSDSGRWTRGRFLKAAGLAFGVAFWPGGRVARASLSDATTDAALGVRSFRSRPDLTPPALTISTPASGAQPGYVFTAPFIGPGQHGPLIVDDSGEPVWFAPRSKATAMNFRVQRYRGKPVLTWWEGKVTSGYGGGTGLILDSSYREVARVRANNGYQSDLHEFLLTSRDTALVAIYSARTADLSTVGGPTAGMVVEGVIQEIDVATGRMLFEWHSLDHVAVEESYRAYPTDPTGHDYFHLNSIGVDLDGNLLVSARHTSTVYKLDRGSGNVIWRLGGRKSDFALGPGASFSFQHDARRHADGTITIFDNGAWSPNGIVEQVSRPIRLVLDTSAMTASLVHTYAIADPRLAIAMGDLQVLPDGGAFIGWGTAGAFSEVAPEGMLRFDARFTGGGNTYRAFRNVWVGTPATKPVAAVAKDGQGAAAVYVSWNGATAVDRWQVRQGARAGALRPVATAPRSGFETTIPLPLATGFVAVAALDAHGKVLGTSPTVSVAAA